MGRDRLEQVLVNLLTHAIKYSLQADIVIMRAVDAENAIVSVQDFGNGIQIRQEETKHMPVLMLSAHPSAEQTALASGADDFLATPFEKDEFLAKVARNF